MEVVKNFCESYVRTKYPTIEHFNKIDIDNVTKDIMKYTTKYALVEKQFDEDTDWQKIMTKEEHIVLSRYNQQAIRQSIKRPGLYGYYVGEPKHEILPYEEFTNKFERDLISICSRSLLLVMDPKGVIHGRLKPFGRTILHTVIMTHEDRFHDEENSECSCTLVPLLIDYGADVSAEDYEGESPFDKAVRNLLYSSMEFMLKTGRIDDNKLNSAILYATDELKHNDADTFSNCLHLLEGYGGDLNSIDQYGNSLLQRYFTSYFTRRSLSIVKVLVESTSNWFSNNIFGISPLHSCIECDGGSDKTDVLSYLCQLSVLNINEQDHNLRSPLIYAVIHRARNCCRTLISNGAHINLKDKHGLTSLHYASTVNDPSIIKLLLNYKETDIHAKDCYGDIPIVYAAATGNSSTLKALYPLYKVDDILYKRLLSVANFNDHSDCFTEIKNLKGEELYRTVGKTKRVELSNRRYQEWLKIQIVATAKKEKIEGNLSSNLQRFYDLERIRESENQKIKNEVTELLKRISKIIREKDEKFSFVPILSGSNAEGTKVGILDEVDFLCILERLSSCLQVTVEESEILPAYVKLRNNPRQTEYDFLLKEINHDFFLSANHVGKQFFIEFFKAMSATEVWKGLHLAWDNKYHIEGEKISTIILTWNGINYKCTEISIDLVPTFVIEKKVKLSSSLQKIAQYFDISDTLQQTLVVAKQANDGFNERQDLLWRYSFSNLETNILQRLPEHARSGYKLVKFIRDARICPLIAQPVYYVSSYLLKTCLLYVVLDELKNNEDYLETIDDRGWGLKILSKLQNFMETKGNVPHFFYEQVELGTRDKQVIKAYCEIGKGWLQHPWEYIYCK